MFRLRSQRILPTVALMCVMAAAVRAGDIKAQLSNDAPRVAESFWLSVTVSAKPGQEVVFPDAPEQIGPFEVLSHKDWFDVPLANQRNWTRNFELISYEGGEFEIPPLQASTGGETLTSESIQLAIASGVEANANLSNFRDVKPQIDIPEEPVTKSRWVAWTVGGAALAAALALVSYLAFRRKKEISPDVWAMKQLEQLRTSEDFHENHATEVTPRIADILRQYIERRFNIPATRQTTEEFLAETQFDRRLTASQQSIVAEFLKKVDEIKFAVRTPDSQSADDAMKLVTNFVRATKGAGN